VSFKVKFWGVRGSIACPSADHMVYGGDTSCLEVTAGANTVILDAGTGIRNLGHDFLARAGADATLLLTHTHWDHINGFPFFAPIYRPSCNFRVMAGHLAGGACIRDIFANLMSNPMFPVPLSALLAKIEFVDFTAGEEFVLGEGLSVQTAALNHPNGATGYRLNFGGKSICYVTDTEHLPGHLDPSVLGLIEGADLVVYDSTYTDAEFPAKVGWGHSTWQQGVRLCRAANVGKLVIFHHDPDHNDDFMAALEQEAKATWEHTVVARDQMVIEL